MTSIISIIFVATFHMFNEYFTRKEDLTKLALHRLTMLENPLINLNL